jgi:mono/diheme cytochrome c family protein
VRTIVVVLLALLVVVAVGAAAGLWYVRATNLSALPQPHPAEARLARAVRRLAVPTAIQGQRNPIQLTSDVVDAGRAHFADHCASCHANDGSGDTEMGRNLFPKAPDMRLRATQSLTDGELFWIIEHGVRFTGMPGWSTGTKEGEAASWQLVHFIRHLPDITAGELEDMAERNPRSPEEVRQDIEAERFLRGEDVR